MTRLLLTLCLLTAVSQAGPRYSDSDFDGVDDREDRCPETPFELTVAADGCPDEPPVSPLTFFAGLGATYTTGAYGGTTTIDSVSTDVTATVYIGDFYASVLGAYYFRGADDPAVADAEEGGFSDIFLSTGYTFNPLNNVFLTPSVNIKIATAAEGLGTGENDYGLSLQGLYRFARADLFFQYGYTVTGDSAAVTYRNVSFGSAGAGVYLGTRGYLSLSYDVSQSYYQAMPDLQSLTLYGVYTLYDTLSLRVNYSLGLSDSASDHALGAMLPKRF